MRSFRLTHLVTVCAALALLATQNHQSNARSTSDRARYHGSGLDAHGGIEGILVDAFAYSPFAGRDLDMPQAATFVVTYTGFTPQAQAAFQRAVDIWAAILSSPVPIHVDASFVNLPGSTLGQAGANFVRRNFTGAPVPNTWFPDAVADRLSGVDLGPTQRPDIEAEFDSTPSAPWYFGLDAQPPGGTFDFVTVVLHELGHGLGFFGSGTVTSGLGTWGFVAGTTRSPTIYDRYVRAAGFPILSVAPPSSLLATAYTSNDLFFQSPPTVTITGTAISSPAKLYAPSPFAPGSSYSHLDEATYPPGSPSSLMTPGIFTAEGQHNPGPITLEIFTDTGWGATAGQAPGTPTVTSASGSPGGILTVTWTSGAGAAPTGHNVQFLQGGAVLATVPHTPSTTFTFSPVPAGLTGTFSVRVQALSGAAASAFSPLFNFTIGTSAPGQPTVVSAGATGGVLTINWTSGAGATPTGHRLDFSQGGVPLTNVTVGAATTFSANVGATQGTFAVQVTAFNGTTPGPPSTPFAFTLGPTCTVPTAPVVSGGIVSGTATVSWAPVAGATGYIVSAGTTAGATNLFPPTNVGPTTSLSASGLPAGFQAFVRVIAVNACSQQGPPTDFLLQ
jgi:hypothetical protein